MINKQLYVPEFARITSVRKESDSVKTYTLRAKEDFKPGQFFQVSVPGAGEAPISISSPPTEGGRIELTVRNTGRVTAAIHRLAKNSFLGLRGPYGNFFPADEMAGRDLIFIAGGIGLAPLRCLIKYVLDRRKRTNHIYLLYGARTQEEMIFKHELKKWHGLDNFDVLLTVDKAQAGYKGNIGVVTMLFDEVKITTQNYAAVVCGPPTMIKYTILKLLKLGMHEKDIFVTLERYMKCGVGKCGHCYLADKYVCVDGPVFSYSQLNALKAAEQIFA